MKTYIQWSAYFNILAGLCLLAYWYLYAILLPYGKLTTGLAILVNDRSWTFVNILGVLGALCGIAGLVGIFAGLEEPVNRWAAFGFTLALLGGVLMTAALLRDTIMWPILAAHDPEMLSFTGPIYSSKAFLPFFIFSAAVYSIGHLVFGLSIAGMPQFPVWIGHLIGWGALLFGLGPLFGNWQVVVRSVGITGMAIGLIWLGWIMHSR